MKKNIRMLAVLAMVAMLLTVVPLASYAESKMVVTGDFVNLRDKQSGGASIGQYNRGTVVTFLGTGNGYMYHVDINGKKGYMSKDYLKPYSATSSTAATKPTEAKKTTTNNNNTTVTAKNVSKNGTIARNNDTVRGTITKQTSVRATANGSSKVVGTLKTRTTVSVLSRKNDYVYITTSTMSGYVPASSVTLNNTKSQTAKVKKVNNGNYKVYTGSTGSGQVVATAKVNNNITVIHQGSQWSYVKIGNTYGYISRQVYDIDRSAN